MSPNTTLTHEPSRDRIHRRRSTSCCGSWAGPSTSGPHERYIRDLDEVLLQLALAETGTACRTAERVISRWSEDFADEPEDRWLERIFGALSAGADIGERAIDTARQIERRYGFAD